MNTVPNTLLVFLFSAIFVGVCTTPQAAPNASASLAGDKKLVVGIWAMQALNEGRTNVAEFRPDGQLLLHAFNCVASSQEPTDVMRYSVADDGKVINMILPTKTIELKVLTFSPQFMQLTSRTGGMEIRYDFEKVDDVDSVCERYPELKAEKARNTPYASSDFVAAPAIPEHPGIPVHPGIPGHDAFNVGRCFDSGGNLNPATAVGVLSPIIGGSTREHGKNLFNGIHGAIVH